MTEYDTAPYSIVVLTGAGISKESGLSTFRDEDGIWATVKIEDVATPDAFAANPTKVHDFYNHRRKGLQSPDIKPNAAHIALRRLEMEWPGEVLIVTQNIDDLHERAGSRNLIHMHGELLKARCTHCNTISAWPRDITLKTSCPNCGQNACLRPHVVWFGETPFMMDNIHEALAKCGLFISIGTSGNVYPASGFVTLIRDVGKAQAVEVNLEPSEGATLFHDAAYGPATEMVPKIVEQILTSG